MLENWKRKKFQCDSVLRCFEACTFLAKWLAVCPSYECKNSFSKWSYVRHLPALLIGPFLSYLFVQYLPPPEDDSGSARTLLALQLSESVVVGHSYAVCFLSLNLKMRSLRSAVVGLGAIGAILPSETLVYDIFPLAVYDLILFGGAIWFHVFFQYDESTNVRAIDHVLTFSYTTPFFLLHFLMSPLRCLLVVATAQARSLNIALLNPTRSTLVGKHYAEVLCRLQWRIHTAVMDLSDAYSFNMFIGTCLFFLIAVYNLYDILTFNLEVDDSNNLGSNISGVIWIGFWGLDIVYLAYLAELLAKEFEAFNFKLHGLIIEDTKAVYSDSKKLLLQIAMQSTPKLSAAGFFTINYSLLLSMTSSAATYLIILIQFAQLKIVNGGPNESSQTVESRISSNGTRLIDYCQSAGFTRADPTDVRLEPLRTSPLPFTT